MKNKPGERLSLPLVLPYDNCVRIQTPQHVPFGPPEERWFFVLFWMVRSGR